MNLKLLMYKSIKSKKMSLSFELNKALKVKEIKRSKKPLFVEVLTDNKQIIYDAYKDY